MSRHVASGEQTGLAGYFLQDPKRTQDLAAVLARKRIFGHGILVTHARQVATRPHACVDDVACSVDRVAKV
ncbi:MAG: hypothetical protein ACC628_19765 [Pirellulaceae bacterium]